MEFLITLSNLILLGLIAIAPLVILIILKRIGTTHTPIFYFTTGIMILAILTFTMAWWSDKSNLILMEHLGYNFDGWNASERLQDVAEENREKVEALELSIMGIGWPVKAIIGFIIAIPYWVVVYIGRIILNQLMIKRNKA